jgi:hypothetical protein
MGFRNSIRVVNQKFFAIAEPDMDYLSQKECEYLDKWFVYCKEKDSKTELSPESHDKAYDIAYARFLEDPQLGTLTDIEIAKAGGATDKIPGETILQKAQECISKIGNIINYK